MKRLLISILMLVPLTASADNVTDLMGLGMAGPLAAEVDAQYSTLVAADLKFSGLARDKFPAAPVITPATAATAVAAAPITQRYNILAAGAPTAAFVQLPAVTISVGERISVFNQGSNPVAIVPSTGLINVAGALTPFACVTATECECTGLTTGAWGCATK